MATPTEACQRHETCQLIPFLFGFQPGPHYTAMLHAYFDESGHPDDPNSQVVSVAAIVSTQAGWHKFCDEWTLTLERYHVTRLHMKDYAHSRGEFATWKGDDTKRRDFLAELVSTVKATVQFAHVSSLAGDDWKATMYDEDGGGKLEIVQQHQQRVQYVFPFWCCLDRIADTWLLPKDQKLAYIFEAGVSGKGAICKFFEEWKLAQNRHGTRVGALSFDDKSSHPGLEAADLLAYEGRLHFLHQEVAPTGTPERESYKRLRGSPKIEWGYIDRTATTRYLEYLRRFQPHLIRSR